MIDWKIVMDYAVDIPELIDTTSSPTTVYERRNIKEIPELLNSDGEIVDCKHWEYEQRVWTKEEWNRMECEINSKVTQIVMQNLSGIIMSQELNDVTAKEERQMIAQSQSQLELAIAQMEVV